MKNIDEFIKLLEKNGELARITEFVSIDGEIAEITDRVVKQQGKALLFESNETQFPVLTNMFGTPKRMAMALGVASLDELPNRIDALFNDAKSAKKSFSDKLKMLSLLSHASKWMPKEVSGKGECQQIIKKGDQINLNELPILKAAPFDGGAFITLPLVHTVDPVTGIRNVGMYRMQVFSRHTTGMHWHRHKTGERHYNEYKKLRKTMPVSVCLGGDPVYTYCATAPLPDGIDEYLLAGFIRNKPVELVKCITNDLRVPADCDFVIEGYVDTAKQKVTEGPFGDHTGFYSLEDEYPTFVVTAITRRKKPVYTATVVGIPPQEDAYIGLATEKIFLSPIKEVLQPEVRGMWLPFEGVAHNLTLFDIEKSYPGQGFKVANAMWGAGQMMLNKFVVITDSLGNELENLEKLKPLLAKLLPKEHLLISRGPLDVLDHSCDQIGFGGKMCIDLTRKIDGECTGTAVELPIPETLSLPEGVHGETALARNGWPILLVTMDKTEENPEKTIAEILEKNRITGIRIVVVFDPGSNLTDYPTLVWIAGNNIDPLRDAGIGAQYVILDARSKFGGFKGHHRPWPNIVLRGQETIFAVDAKWGKLGLGEFIESPSLKYKPLYYGGGAAVTTKN